MSFIMFHVDLLYFAGHALLQNIIKDMSDT
jgi:hypothetical protein